MESGIVPQVNYQKSVAAMTLKLTHVNPLTEFTSKCHFCLKFAFYRGLQSITSRFKLSLERLYNSEDNSEAGLKIR